jgi:glycyl-tRNA synthetase beta chain
MVIEFPALQGTVGSIYAGRTGEGAVVAKAIGEQYLPKRIGDALPSSVAGALLSIAEKCDNLAASFGLGHVPTGSEDPYALRRQAVGMMLTLIEHGFAFSVSGLVRLSAAELQREAHGFNWTDEAEEALGEFFRSRERVHLTDRGYRYDLVDAALEVDWDVPLSLQRRLDALVDARESGLLGRLYRAFERCHNICRGCEPAGVSADRFTEPVEGEVFEALKGAEESSADKLSTLDFAGALAALEPLCGPVDRLFDEVLIMAEDEAVRENRLALLARVSALFGGMADFTRLTWD